MFGFRAVVAIMESFSVVFFLIMGIWHMIKVCEAWVSMCVNGGRYRFSTAVMRINQVAD